MIVPRPKCEVPCQVIPKFVILLHETIALIGPEVDIGCVLTVDAIEITEDGNATYFEIVKHCEFVRVIAEEI